MTAAGLPSDFSHTHAEMICGQAAVRLDDAIAMVEIRGNRFVNCGSGDFGAVQINSGRRNRVVGNVFENCPRKISAGDSCFPVPDGAWYHVWNPAKRHAQVNRERIARENYRKAFPGVETLPDDPFGYEDRDNVEIGPHAERAPKTVPRASTNAWWQARHREKLAAVAARPGQTYDVVLVGDSIVHGWEKDATVWKASFADRGLAALNLGFAGDRTEQALWRLEHGELDGYEAKNVVLLIGTNDATLERPAHVIAQGIRDCVAAIRARQPKARVLLHPIFPRGINSYGIQHRRHAGPRRRCDQASSMVRPLADGERVVWCDIRTVWTPAGWGVARELMPDAVHPSAAGYRLWADALGQIGCD